MYLAGKVLYFVFCITIAIAFPNLSQTSKGNEDIYEMIFAEVRSVLIDTYAFSPAEQACATSYKNQTDQINDLLFNQTNLCFDTANKTMSTNDQNANATVTVIRKQLLDIQTQLSNCTSITDAIKFLNCTTTTFDSNLLNLDNANSEAHLTAAVISVNQTQIDIQRAGCVSSVIGRAKTNFTEAANVYNGCLEVIKLVN